MKAERIDVFLKHVCLLKSRSLAKTACERGYVRVQGKPAKPSTPVRPGDVIELDFPLFYRKIRVLGVPERQVSKKQAPQYYEVVEERSRQAVVQDLIDEILQEIEQPPTQEV